MQFDCENPAGMNDVFKSEVNETHEFFAPDESSLFSFSALDINFGVIFSLYLVLSRVIKIQESRSGGTSINPFPWNRFFPMWISGVNETLYNLWAVCMKII